MSAAPRTTPTITPGLLYHDAANAIEWLCRAFGFEKRLVVAGDAGSIAHAHLTLGNGGIMLSSAENHAFAEVLKTPREAGGVGTQEVLVWVADIDAHCACAKAAGAHILIDIEDKPYGGRGYSCRDPEGHVWGFGSYDPWAQST